jgi:hypothetical protein
MKRVGIISYFNYYNYGSMLQGFALQYYIKSVTNDIECELINYRGVPPTNSSKWRRLVTRVSRLGYYLLHTKEIYTKSKYAQKLAERNRYFDEFLQTMTVATKTLYHNKSQLIKNPPIYDIYVTGSDQTWSPNVSGGFDLSPMFLDFAVDGAKKVAYAPSLGVNSFTCEQELYIRKKLQGYSILSCRETGGAVMLSKILDKQIPAVVDPTLLLNKECWNTLAHSPRIGKKYIFCYFLGNRQYYRSFAQQLSNQTGLPIYYIPVNWHDFSDADNLLWNAGPLDFVGLINDAEYICTDSFHGVAFSSNLNKNFYAFVKHRGTADVGDNSRLFDYLKRIGLENRLLTQYDGGEINIEDIDYSMANKKIAEEREFSYQYINQIIQL